MQKLIVAGLVSLALVGCNSGSSGSNTGKINLAFSDAPVDGKDIVCVAFDEITVHHVNGSESSWSPSFFAVEQSSLECTPNRTLNDIPGYRDDKTDPEYDPEFMVINLMDYQGEQALQVISDEVLEAGKYTQMRLSVVNGFYLGDPNDYPYSFIAEMEKIVENEEEVEVVVDPQPISVPSGKLKLDGFDVQADATQAYTLEFDLRKSMVLNNNGYQLKPRGVRLVNNEDVATISGDVAGDSDACGGLLENAFVYVYTAPTGGNYGDLGSDTEPYTTVAVDVDDRTFEVGYVPLGDYDIALVCNGNEDDSEDADDVLIIDDFFADETLTASGRTFTF